MRLLQATAWNIMPALAGDSMFTSKFSVFKLFWTSTTMTTCFAFGCSHNAMRETCKFFRFPTEKRKRCTWIDASRLVSAVPCRTRLWCDTDKFYYVIAYVIYINTDYEYCNIVENVLWIEFHRRMVAICLFVKKELDAHWYACPKFLCGVDHWCWDCQVMVYSCVCMHFATGDWTGSLHHWVGCIAATLKMARRQMAQVSSATNASKRFAFDSPEKMWS